MEGAENAPLLEQLLLAPDLPLVFGTQHLEGDALAVLEPRRLQDAAEASAPDLSVEAVARQNLTHVEL